MHFPLLFPFYSSNVDSSLKWIHMTLTSSWYYNFTSVAHKRKKKPNVPAKKRNCVFFFFSFLKSYIKTTDGHLIGYFIYILFCLYSPHHMNNELKWKGRAKSFLQNIFSTLKVKSHLLDFGFRFVCLEPFIIIILTAQKSPKISCSFSIDFCSALVYLVCYSLNMD